MYVGVSELTLTKRACLPLSHDVTTRFRAVTTMGYIDLSEVILWQASTLPWRVKAEAIWLKSPVPRIPAWPSDFVVFDKLRAPENAN